MTGLVSMVWAAGRTCGGYAWVACIAAAASAQVPVATFAQAPAQSARTDGVIRSVLFDTKGAAAARERALPQYIESIVVEGRDPDAPPRKLVPLEHRFAQTLLAPSAASAYGLRAPDTRPCMSLASAWNPSFANNFVPLSGCPR